MFWHIQILGFKYITTGKEYLNWSDQILAIPGAVEYQQRKKVPKESSFGKVRTKEIEGTDGSNELGCNADKTRCVI